MTNHKGALIEAVEAVKKGVLRDMTKEGYDVTSVHGIAIDRYCAALTKNVSGGEAFKNLKHGLYKIFWESGGCSLACVGSTYDGTRWLTCANWTTRDNYKPAPASCDWSGIERVELILEDNYEEGSALTAPAVEGIEGLLAKAMKPFILLKRFPSTSQMKRRKVRRSHSFGSGL